MTFLAARPTGPKQETQISQTGPRCSLAFVLILFSSIALLAQDGATFYVSTSGSDSNPGTLNQPWMTIEHAANTATAGATVYVLGGVYNESVNFPNSGTAGAPITFESYPGQAAIIDGTGLTPSGIQGLVNITNQSYLTIRGFEIRNYTTDRAAVTPSGVWITGYGAGVKILDNRVHHITTKSEANGNAFGISVYGTSQTPITQLVINGNEVYQLKTGQSESVNVDGNVIYFRITNNLIHDNDNIGIDAIGYEGVGPVGYDEAMYGEISGNTIYNISGIANAGEGDEYDADGLYCDGCAYVTFERNVIFQVDYGIETTSENQVCQEMVQSGPAETPAPERLAQASIPVTAGLLQCATTSSTRPIPAAIRLAVMPPQRARGDRAMEEAAAITTSSSTTLCTTTGPSQAIPAKVPPAANSRFNTRWARIRGTFMKTTFSTPAHPTSGSTATFLAARPTHVPLPRSIGTSIIRLPLTSKERQFCGVTCGATRVSPTGKASAEKMLTH